MMARLVEQGGFARLSRPQDDLAQFFDPNVCHLAYLDDVPEWFRKTWRCPRCGYRWHLEHLRSEDGSVLYGLQLGSLQEDQPATGGNVRRCDGQVRYCFQLFPRSSFCELPDNARPPRPEGRPHVRGIRIGKLARD